jgi:RHH-type transcriptional regulator, rel operon repressor / antitoxin RelB
VPQLSLRLDEALLDRVIERADAYQITSSRYIRDLVLRDLDLGVDPGGFHARFDELHATSIQTLAILAASIGNSAPDILEQGMADAKDLLRDRGLLDPEMVQ